MKSIIFLKFNDEACAANCRATRSGALSSMIRATKRAAYAKSARPWVAAMTENGRVDEFIRPLWQRKRANGSFTRGTELCFVLSSGTRYRVHDPAGRGYGHCIVTDDGEIQWLNDR